MLGSFHTYHYVDKPQTPKLILSSNVPFMSQALLSSVLAPCIEREFQYGKKGDLSGKRATAERQNMCFTWKWSYWRDRLSEVAVARGLSFYS